MSWDDKKDPLDDDWLFQEKASQWQRPMGGADEIPVRIAQDRWPALKERGGNPEASLLWNVAEKEVGPDTGKQTKPPKPGRRIEKQVRSCIHALVVF